MFSESDTLKKLKAPENSNWKISMLEKPTLLYILQRDVKPVSAVGTSYKITQVIIKFGIQIEIQLLKNKNHPNIYIYIDSTIHKFF